MPRGHSNYVCIRHERLFCLLTRYREVNMYFLRMCTQNYHVHRMVLRPRARVWFTSLCVYKLCECICVEGWKKKKQDHKDEEMRTVTSRCLREFIPLFIKHMYIYVYTCISICIRFLFLHVYRNLYLLSKIKLLIFTKLLFVKRILHKNIYFLYYSIFRFFF